MPGSNALGHLEKPSAKPARRDHGAAKFGAQEPRRLLGAEAQFALQLHRRHAVGMRRHQEGGPEPDAERQMRAVHHRAGGDRGLLAAGRAGEGQDGPAGKPPGLRAAAAGTAETRGPSRLLQPEGCRCKNRLSTARDTE
jgi:hypothetical protein